MAELDPGLYLVATPIGNLGDMTIRGIEILKNVDLIGAEDTRHSGILLHHFNIKTPMVSYHQHNAAKRREEFLTLLKEGKSIALISDAGTPGISDPGEDLVKAAAMENLAIHPIPGGNAVLSALTASAQDCRYFTFEGFLPKQKKERKERLTILEKIPTTLILYIAPHALAKDLADIFAALGNREATLCRELTKIHESYYRMPLGAMIEMAENTELKGEMVLVIAPPPKNENLEIPSPQKLKTELNTLTEQGVKAKIAAQIIADKYGMKKNEIYPLTFED
ncbi:MAG: 16S rRNA (cytidine(1402)-2'-O)-methyltransferase [Clostridiales bacterium]